MSKVLFRFLMVLLFTSLACTVPFLGVDINEWFVAPTGRDTNTCTSADQPCRTIQGALTKAGDGHGVINVAAGTYLENVTIRASIAISGAGAATTIVDGGGSGPVFDLRLPDGAATPSISVLLSGLTIQNGHADNGGGIRAWDGVELTVVNTVVQNNRADGNAGGILNSGGEVNLLNVTVASNEAGVGCGGVDNYGSRMDLFRVVLNDNLGPSSGAGGCNRTDATMIMRNSQVIGNHSGGLANGGVLTVFGSTFSGNDNPEAGSVADAILNTGTVSVYNSVIQDGEEGIATSCRATIVGTTISGNSLIGLAYSDPADGIFPCHTGSPDLVVRNSTISGNGIGIYMELLEFIPWRIESSTIAFNSTGFYSDQGISFEEDEALVNSIIANNTSRDCIPVPIPSLGRNMDSDGSCDFSGGRGHFHSVNPQLDALGDYGGPTPTHRLRSGSPAIDQADGGLCPSSDQRFVVRPIGGGCDIGAYEREFAITAETPAPTETLVAIFTETPEGLPTITLTVDANCRSGDSTAYNVVTSFKAGDTFQIDGRNAATTWFWILMPQGGHCWLAGSNGTIVGLVDLVRIIALPTPTPTLVQATAPTPPSGLQAVELACDAYSYKVKLSWEDNSNNESGFRIYHNGQVVATVGANTTQYTHTVPNNFGQQQNYYVEAYNDAGAVKSNTATEDGCVY